MSGVLQPGEGAALAAGAFNKLRLGLGFSASNTHRTIGQMQDLRLWRATLSYYEVLAAYDDVSADFPSDHWHYPMHGTLEAALNDCEACGAAHCARGTCADFTVRSPVMLATGLSACLIAGAQDEPRVHWHVGCARTRTQRGSMCGSLSRDQRVTVCCLELAW